MRTLLWKEFRENWKWGVLLLVASAIFHVASQTESNPRIVLFSADYLACSALGFSVGALLLGLMQTVFEAQRDRWAYLRHRAITPERILLAKAIVGLSLYFAAVLIPLLLLAIWESIPGHVPAPFHWSAPIGGVAAMLSGATYWFAGALIGVRDVRWYGTRLLPVGLPIAGTFGTLVALESWGWLSVAGLGAALSVVAATLTPMVIATAGAFRNRTGYLNQTRGSRWCLALSSACSLWLLTLSALMIVAGTMEDLRFPWMWPTSVVTHEIDRHGRLIRFRRAINPLDPWSGAIHDHDLTIVDAGASIDPSVSFSDFVPFVPLSHKRAELNTPRAFGRRFDQGGPFELIHSYRIGGHQAIHWYFDQHEGVLLGYSHRTRRLAWRAGPDGVVPADQPVTRRFSGSMIDPDFFLRVGDSGFRWARQQAGEQIDGNKLADQWSQTVPFADGLYLFDRVKPQLTRWYAIEPPARLVSLAVSHWKEESALWMVRDHQIRKYVLAEDGRVLPAIDPDGLYELTEDLLRAEFTIPDTLQGVGRFEFAELPHKNLVVYRVQQTDSAIGQTTVIQTLVATPQGQILRHVVSDFEQGFHRQARLIATPMLPAIPTTILTTWLSPSIERVSTPGVEIESVSSPPSRTFSIVMWVSSVLSLLVTGVLTRRWRFSRTSSLGWLAATVALGPAGLLTLLTLRERLVNVTCSGCQAPRPRTSERCPHCGQLFAEPTRNGTEIFAMPAESKLSQSIAASAT